MNLHPIHAGREGRRRSTCHKNRDKRRPDQPLGLSETLPYQVEGQQLQQKDKKRRKGRAKKKIKKNEKPKQIHQLTLTLRDLCACPNKNLIKRDDANAFLSRLEILWLISRLKMPKMSKTWVFP